MGMLGPEMPEMTVCDGLIDAWCTDEHGQRDGFVMEPVGAMCAGIKLIALASDLLVRTHPGEPAPTIANVPIKCVPADAPGEEFAASIVLNFGSAPVAFALGAGELAELAAALTAASRAVG
jgi:hypothetical protein